MNIRPLIVALCLISSPVLADDPRYVGRWTQNTADCIGQPDIEPMQVWAWKVQGYDFSCTIDQVTKTGDSSWEVASRCIGEGESYSSRLEWVVNQADSTMMETNLNNLGGPTVIWHRCPWD